MIMQFKCLDYKRVEIPKYYCKFINNNNFYLISIPQLKPNQCHFFMMQKISKSRNATKNRQHTNIFVFRTKVGANCHFASRKSQIKVNNK